MKLLRRALLRWYRANRRALPWRETRDPYAIWVSETMLQQTRVETVIPYYHRFLERFPDVRALASADTDDVLGAWAGLGYYSRARNLQAAARVVVEEHGGELPDDPGELRALPGIGRYTAGAVASIAFDRPEPVLDGNVIRVLSRVLGVREDVKRPTVNERLWGAAAALAEGPDPGDLNQALMELGATCCTPRAPDCGGCPLERHCDAHRAGDAESLPVKKRATRPRRVEAVAALVVRRGKALAVRRPPEGLLGGLWDLPGGALGGEESPGVGLVRALRQHVGLAVDSAEAVGQVEHVFTHRRLRLYVFRCRNPEGRTRLEGFDAHRWLSPTGLASLPHGAVTGKALSLLDLGGVEA